MLKYKKLMCTDVSFFLKENVHMFLNQTFCHRKRNYNSLDRLQQFYNLIGVRSYFQDIRSRFIWIIVLGSQVPQDMFVWGLGSHLYDKGPSALFQVVGSQIPPTIRVPGLGSWNLPMRWFSSPRFQVYPFMGAFLEFKFFAIALNEQRNVLAVVQEREMFYG